MSRDEQSETWRALAEWVQGDPDNRRVSVVGGSGGPRLVVTFGKLSTSLGFAGGLLPVRSVQSFLGKWHG